MFYKLFNITENKYISYTAVVLTRESSDLLIKKFSNITPENWTIHAHHMTINMKEASEGPAAHFVGEKVQLNVISYAINDKALAVGVETNVPSNNKIKHVTIATSPIGKPGDSNDLTEWKPLPQFSIEGIVEEVESEGEAPKPKVFVPPTPPSPDTPEEFIKFLKHKPINVIRIALKNKFPGVSFDDQKIQDLIKTNVVDKL